MAQLKNTNVNDFGFLQLPAGTTAQRPQSATAGMIRFNTSLNKSEYYDGSAWRPISDSNPEATGGTVVDTDIGGVPYRIHYFTETDTDTLTVTNPGEVEYLIVAGGGGGASRNGGGGGAGGLLSGIVSVNSQSYTVIVGQGGTGGAAGGNNPGENGGDSSVFGFTAIGGGGGGHWGGNDGRDGGSGGGGHQSSSSSGSGGSGIPAQGNDGGDGSGNTSSPRESGGGGGAGSSGVQDGSGGQGILSLITGDSNFYSGGGGGGIEGNSNVPGGVGGLGGGASAPFSNAANIPGNNATSNTGGGGSGGVGSGSSSTHLEGGNGGSGIVVVRYRRNASTATTPNLTLRSTLPNTSKKWTVAEVQRFVPATTPRVLIHAESEGLNNRNGFRRTRVDINGTTVLDASTPRSLRLTQLRRSGVGWQLIESRTFDAYGQRTGTSTRGTAEQALNFLQTFQDGDLLINTTYDHLRNHDLLAPEYAANFFSRSTTDFTLESSRGSHLLVAIKNERLFYENYRTAGLPGFTISLWLE